MWNCWKRRQQITRNPCWPVFQQPPQKNITPAGGWTNPVEPILAQVELWIIWYGQEVPKCSKKTTIYPGILVQHVHLSRVTFSEATAEIFLASITPKNESTQKKRMAFSSLGETLSLQNHTKSWKGHPATPSPPPDTLPRPRFDGHFLGIAGEVVFFLHMSGVHQASCRCLAYATDQLLEVVFSKLSPVVRRPGTQ